MCVPTEFIKEWTATLREALSLIGTESKSIGTPSDSESVSRRCQGWPTPLPSPCWPALQSWGRGWHQGLRLGKHLPLSCILRVTHLVWQHPCDWYFHKLASWNWCGFVFFLGGYGPFLSSCSWTNKICWQKKSWQGNQKLKTTSQSMPIILSPKTVRFQNTVSLTTAGANCSFLIVL